VRQCRARGGSRETPDGECIQFSGRTEGGVLLDLPLASLSDSERTAAMTFFCSRGFATPSDLDIGAPSATIAIALPNARTATELASGFFAEIHHDPPGLPLKITEFK